MRLYSQSQVSGEVKVDDITTEIGLLSFGRSRVGALA